MTLSSRHRIRNSSPGGLRPSTLPLGHGGSPQYSHVDGEETFCFFQTAETGNRTPNSSVKGSVSTSRSHWSDPEARELYPMLCYCRPSVEDDGPTITQHWVNVSCMLGIYSRDDSIYYVWKVKCFFPAHSWRFNFVGSLRDREAVCLALDRQGSNFESCVWSAVSSH